MAEEKKTHRKSAKRRAVQPLKDTGGSKGGWKAQNVPIPLDALWWDPNEEDGNMNELDSSTWRPHVAVLKNGTVLTIAHKYGTPGKADFDVRFTPDIVRFLHDSNNLYKFLDKIMADEIGYPASIGKKMSQNKRNAAKFMFLWNAMPENGRPLLTSRDVQLFLFGYMWTRCDLCALLRHIYNAKGTITDNDMQLSMGIYISLHTDLIKAHKYRWSVPPPTFPLRTYASTRALIRKNLADSRIDGDLIVRILMNNLRHSVPVHCGHHEQGFGYEDTDTKPEDRFSKKYLSERDHLALYTSGAVLKCQCKKIHYPTVSLRSINNLLTDEIFARGGGLDLSKMVMSYVVDEKMLSTLFPRGFAPVRVEQ